MSHKVVQMTWDIGNNGVAACHDGVAAIYLVEARGASAARARCLWSQVCIRCLQGRDILDSNRIGAMTDCTILRRDSPFGPPVDDKHSYLLPRLLEMQQSFSMSSPHM